MPSAGMIEMARYPRYFLAKTLRHSIIDNLGFFAGRLKRLNRLLSNLFMEPTPIQVFPVHRIIEHILAHGVLQAFPRKHPNGFFLQSQPEQ